MYRFTTDDIIPMTRELVERGAADLDGDSKAFIETELDRLGVDFEAIKAMVGGNPDACAAVHLGLLIAEHQHAQDREAVPA